MTVPSAAPTARAVTRLVKGASETSLLRLDDQQYRFSS
jgi:hypothetical protein